MNTMNAGAVEHLPDNIHWQSYQQQQHHRQPGIPRTGVPYYQQPQQQQQPQQPYYEGQSGIPQSLAYDDFPPQNHIFQSNRQQPAQRSPVYSRFLSKESLDQQHLPHHQRQQPYHQQQHHQPHLQHPPPHYVDQLGGPRTRSPSYHPQPSQPLPRQQQQQPYDQYPYHHDGQSNYTKPSSSYPYQEQQHPYDAGRTDRAPGYSHHQQQQYYTEQLGMPEASSFVYGQQQHYPHRFDPSPMHHHAGGGGGGMPRHGELSGGPTKKPWTSIYKDYHSNVSSDVALSHVHGKNTDMRNGDHPGGGGGGQRFVNNIPLPKNHSPYVNKNHPMMAYFDRTNENPTQAQVDEIFRHKPELNSNVIVNIFLRAVQWKKKKRIDVLGGDKLSFLTESILHLSSRMDGRQLTRTAMACVNGLQAVAPTNVHMPGRTISRGLYSLYFSHFMK